MAEIGVQPFTVGPIAQTTFLQYVLGNPEQEFLLSSWGRKNTLPHHTPVGEYVLWRWGV